MEKEDKIGSRKKIAGLVLSLLVFILLLVFVSITSAIVFALFVIALVRKLDYGIPIAVSIGLLCLCPILLVLKQQSAAEIVANWAYYIFSIAVVLFVVRYVKSDPGKSTSVN
jgi:phosphoglycerol transferase MdoB-like AlkP superfamily enzyme